MNQLEQDYACTLGVRSAFFMPAENTACALARLGLVGARDRVIVFAGEFEHGFSRRLPSGTVEFVPDPSVDTFVQKSEEESLAPDEHEYWFVNSIGGFGLRVPALRKLAKAARERRARLIVDNTVVSAFGCNPIEQGAWLCLEALDRVFSGGLAEKLVAVSASGEDSLPADIQGFSCPESALPPQASTLFETFAARMQRHFDCARAIAEYLHANEMIPAVYYPGLSDHTDHDAATGTLKHGFGPAVDFELPNGFTAELFIGRIPDSFRSAPAGGELTRVSPIKGKDAEYVRLFAGREDPINVADSLDQALRWFCNPPEP